MILRLYKPLTFILIIIPIYGDINLENDDL